MNFVGHAMVARWESDRAAYAFGAMLPDFEHMCGTRLDDVDDPEVTAGSACHHRVDAVFHAAPTFSALCRRARATLGARGLPRGTVLAVSHIGVELIIDGVLSEDPRIVTGFVPHAFADRVLATLSRRPRLDPGSDGRDALVDWAIVTRPEIADATPTLASELRAEL